MNIKLPDKIKIFYQKEKNSKWDSVDFLPIVPDSEIDKYFTKKYGGVYRWAKQTENNNERN